MSEVEMQLIWLILLLFPFPLLNLQVCQLELPPPSIFDEALGYIPAEVPPVHYCHCLISFHSISTLCLTVYWSSIILLVCAHLLFSFF